MIAKTLYLCKDVETFGSGIRKIYSLCTEKGVQIGYRNTDTDFSLIFYRTNRNIMPNAGTINGTINVTTSENDILQMLKENNNLTIAELAVRSGKSVRTINRVINNLKKKGFIERVGSNKKGFWKVK